MYDDPDGYLFFQKLRAETVADLIRKYNMNIKKAAKKYKIPVSMIQEIMNDRILTKSEEQVDEKKVQLEFDFKELLT